MMDIGKPLRAVGVTIGLAMLGFIALPGSAKAWWRGEHWRRHLGTTSGGLRLFPVYVSAPLLTMFRHR